MSYAMEADPMPGRRTRRKGHVLTLLILASLLFSLIPVTAQVALAVDPPFTVNTFADPDPTTISGGCAFPSASSVCSLRLAVIESLAGATTITLPAGTYILTRTNTSTTNE